MAIWTVKIVGWGSIGLLLIVAATTAVVDAFSQPERVSSPVVLRIKDGDEFIEFTLDEVRTFRTWWSAWNE